MVFDDKTTLGGSQNRFPATAWTLILDSNTSDKDRSEFIIAELYNRYWKPVYCYLRRKNYGNEDAKDLTQAFFHEIVLGRDLIVKADPAKGRFRTLLLTALERYLKDVHRFNTRIKRHPEGKFFKLEEFDESCFIEQNSDMSAKDVFQYAWLSELLNNILSDVKQECLSADMTVHWQVFSERLLKPILENTNETSLTEICQKYDIDSEKKASNMIITVKRRLRKAVERHLKKLADSDSEAESEIAEIISLFS